MSPAETILSQYYFHQPVPFSGKYALFHLLGNQEQLQYTSYSLI